MAEQEFHNEYLYPRPSTKNPFGVPGKLAKGYLFALRVTEVSAGPSSEDGTGSTGQRNSSDAGGATTTSSTSTTYQPNLGSWQGFPPNLHMEHLDPGSLEDVAGNYYEDFQGFIGQEVLFFPVNEEGDWVDLNGNPQPDGLDAAARAAWYLSVLDQIPKWKTFTDNSGEQYIYHGVRMDDGSLTGYVESYTAHTNPNSANRDLHVVRVNRAPGPGDPGFPGGGASASTEGVSLGDLERQFDLFGVHRPNRSSAGVSTLSAIDFNRFKVFQFNPVSWEFSYEMLNTAPSDSLQPGGSAGAGMAPGYVNTRVALTFDRSQEVYAATMRSNNRVDPIFAKVGVQQDVFEVFKIMMDPAEYENVLGSSIDPDSTSLVVGPGQVAHRVPTRDLVGTSMAEMNNLMFDIGLGGASVAFSPIAVVFNDNFTVQGHVTGVNVAYAAFNYNLVPTICQITLDIQVLNVASREASTLLNPTGTQLTLPDPSLSTSVPSAAGGTTGRTRRVSRSSLIPQVQSVPGTSVRYSAQ